MPTYYCYVFGGFVMEGNNGAGKGDSYRPVDYQKWSANWDAIFDKKTDKKKPLKNQKRLDLCVGMVYTLVIMSP
jgi:hypothetical protein